MVTLSTRQLNILISLISSNDYLTIKYLSNKLNVSERTIRYDLDIITDFLEEFNSTLIKKQRHGIKINASSEKIKNIKYYLENDANFIYLKNERILILKFLLLITPGYLTLDYLSSFLCVSKNTIVSDLTKLEQTLEQNLYLLRKPANGIKIVGPEYKIRNESYICVDRIIEANIMTITSIKSQIGENFIELAEKIITSKETFTNSKFSHHNREFLVIRFAIAVKRLLGGAKLEKLSHDPKLQTNSIQTTMQSLKIIEDNSKIKLSKMDIIYFNQLFNCEKNFDDLIKETDPSLIEEMVSNLLLNIKDYLEIDLSDDLEFIKGLKVNLITMLYHNPKDFKKYNILTDKVKYRYPYIFEILRTILKDSNILSVPNIDDEEIAFISLYMGTAIERKKGENLIPKALLVSNNSYSMSYILKTKIELYTPEIICFGPINSEKIDSVLINESVDFIITTEKISIDNYEIINVDPFLNDGDIQNIKSIAFRLSVKKQMSLIQDFNKASDRYFLGQLLKKENYVFKENVSNWVESIKIAAAPLIKSKIINDNYINSIIVAVEEIGPYMVFIPNIAIAHSSLSSSVIENCLSLLVVENGFKFGNLGNVEVNAVIIIGSKDSKNYFSILYKLISILERHNNIEKLIHSKYYEDIKYLV